MIRPLIVVLLTAVAVPAVAAASGAPAVPAAANLLSLQEGTVPVVEPESYGGWPAENVLDGSASSGWACAEGKIKGNRFVFEMPFEAVLERFEFDNAGVDSEGAGARNLTVEVSTTSKSAGFTPVLQARLKDRTDGQGFAAAARVPARWVRLSILDNQGSASWTELFSFRGYGARPATPALPAAISGTYATDYSDFHVRQQGTALTGCYEYNDGLLDGSIEGRVMKITWREGESTGPAVMVFSPDGNSFRGYWWNAGNDQGRPRGRWNGTRKSAEVGGCPHWSGSVGGELEKSLAATGRARLYGILFDLDSATIRRESEPVLDEVLRSLREQPSWRLTIEGHTDATGGDAHNLELSRKRAEAVKAYLVAAGIGADRLEAVGFGASKPVADNATELGRAQNRRVELVRLP